jgi:hypothetical protein
MNKSFLATTLASVIMAFSMMTISTPASAHPNHNNVAKHKRCVKKAFAVTALLYPEYGVNITKKQREARWVKTYNNCYHK